MRKNLIELYLLCAIPFAVFSAEPKGHFDEMTTIYSSIEACRSDGWQIQGYTPREDFSFLHMGWFKKRIDDHVSFERIQTSNPLLKTCKANKIRDILHEISDSENYDEALFRNFADITNTIFPRFIHNPSLEILLGTNKLYIEREASDLQTYRDNLTRMQTEIDSYISGNPILSKLTWSSLLKIIDSDTQLAKSSSIIATIVDDLPRSPSLEESAAQSKKDKLANKKIPEISEAIRDKMIKVSELLEYYSTQMSSIG